MSPNPLPREPVITINGVTLTEGQAMTVRVMLTSAASELEDPEMRADLGPIADGYRARLREVLVMLVGK